jgi:hypothetical protein
MQAGCCVNARIKRNEGRLKRTGAKSWQEKLCIE